MLAGILDASKKEENLKGMCAECAQRAEIYRNALVCKKKYGGPDGTRTRDPRRDRPVF
jgi:hypothetical protein